MYSKINDFLARFFPKHTLLKHGFNLAPMYRRSCGKLYFVSENLHQIKIKIPLSFKNKNYVGTMFGGSMLSATDPIYMIQLMYILGKDYVVWDKAADVRFKRPANSAAFADFMFTTEEIASIKQQVDNDNEIDLLKIVDVTNKDKSIVFAQLSKTIYVAKKEFYKAKLQRRNTQ